jgi:ABC-type nitrate/sulfonate/bicarbonate transport system substrate-binding protein
MGKGAWARAAPHITTAPLLIACAVAWHFLPEQRSERASPAVVAPAARDSLRVGVPSNCYSGLLALAERRGMFDADKVPVELVSFPSGRRAFRSLLSGEVELAVVGDIPIASTSLERDDFTVLAVLGRSTFDRWVVARPDLKTPGDLRGKRIATQKRSGSHYVLEAYLDGVGVPISDVEIVDMPAEEMPKALASGRVDAFAVESPYSAPSQEEFGIPVEELQDPGAYRLAFALVGRRDVVERVPQVIERMLRQLVAAADAWNEDVERGVQDLSEVLVLDAAKAALECHYASFEVVLDAPVQTAVRQEATWFSKHGKGYGKPLPDFARLFDADLLRAVSPQAVRL